MKNVFMMRKKKDAVSPVIATILMVAITVVLAAVLYVMVIGMGINQELTPSGFITTYGRFNSGSNTGYIDTTIGQINHRVMYSELKVLIVDQSGGLYTISQVVTASGGNIAISWPTGVNIAGSGQNLVADGNANLGDTFTISGIDLASGHTYKVTLIYIPSGGEIASQLVVLP